MNGQQRRDGENRPQVPHVDVHKIMTEGPSRLMTEQTEVFGTYLAKRAQLKTSQIRNIFGTVRKIEMIWRPNADPKEVAKAQRQLIMLKPKMKYQAEREWQRNKSTGVRDLAEVLSPAIDEIGGDRQKFQNFVDLFEAILAYHTAAGGKN
jgi:CRISPR-associated protein Csm2